MLDDRFCILHCDNGPQHPAHNKLWKPPLYLQLMCMGR